MHEAASIVLDGFSLEPDAKVVSWPDRNHDAIATDAAFQAVGDPTGQTMTRKPTDEALASGSRGGSIAGISGAIGDFAGGTTDADSLDIS